MGELRRDPVRNRWVVIDPERPDREAALKVEAQPPPPLSGPCPLCPGNEAMTPPEIIAFGESSRQRNQTDWSVRVTPDLQPLCRIEGDFDRRPEGPFDVMNALGAHEIVIESPQHLLTWAEFPEQQLERVLRTYRMRSLDLRLDGRFRSLIVVKNNADAAGILRHPHSHVLALPFIPYGIEEELRGCREFYARKERCAFCDIILHERVSRVRRVVETDFFVVLAPFASRFPFETWLLPLRHASDFGKIGEKELVDLASLVKRTMQMVGKVLGNPSCTIVLHSTPFDEPHTHDYHWHLEIIPKTAPVAAFGWGARLFVNPIPPEEAAALMAQQM
ncbi:galactose-1-phosphate uridylyltransferase [Candidatus Methylomirabilis lanthanidiphila]|uniref:Galactose-1-phosphate uridylyltransferase n=1 Tax=Candidatus Methylomirabilis lanthanidiphila TaxID=2211376 RepID=A0A564ZMP4_9BACT|nr:galactose-1-phosphate uridylyltransferase [Candidatus Methylomirabilis lanthanidiphila]VUZ85818.1 galactose-1-phosphate uridylyltransferase [Candidatus Methylomirabilis lanthanidiphila]